MKVKISYTMKLEEVSEVVCSFLKSGADELGEASQDLCSLPVLLKSKEGLPALVAHLDRLRQSLADVDQQLAEAQSMAEGLVEANTTLEAEPEHAVPGEQDRWWDADEKVYKKTGSNELWTAPQEVSDASKSV